MCCNGVLFGDVELQRGDHAPRLAAHGLELFRKGRKRAFAQPCSCFDGKWCRIYAARPQRCAAFDCGLLKRVQRGECTVAAALSAIRATRKAADRVRTLVRKLGNHEETRPLNQRYGAVLAQPLDFAAGAAANERRGKLIQAVTQLADRLERDFLE
jgi:Fe-S-cluster containining protein